MKNERTEFAARCRIIAQQLIGLCGLIRRSEVRAMLASPAALRANILRYGPKGYDLMTPEQHADLCDYYAAKEEGRILPKPRTEAWLGVDADKWLRDLRSA